jgi:protein-L-isoaspartate(D-aspartate) O-methyltransferase
MTSGNGHSRVDYRGERERMMRLLRREIRDPRVLDAMEAVPREAFVPPQLAQRAYDDGALPIGEGQTISQPLIVALMLEALRLRGDERVLEVGTGSGYVAALLSRLALRAVTVERKPALLAAARRRLEALGVTNVQLFEAGETLGRPEDAPYDGILVSAAAPHVPRVLIEQLAPLGRLVIPVGGLRSQELIRATLTPHGLELQRLGPCVFVPLIGDQAWREDAGGTRGDTYGDDVSRRSKVR